MKIIFNKGRIRNPENILFNCFEMKHYRESYKSLFFNSSIFFIFFLIFKLSFLNTLPSSFDIILIIILWPLLFVFISIFSDFVSRVKSVSNIAFLILIASFFLVFLELII